MLSLFFISAFLIEQPCFAIRVEAIPYPGLAVQARIPGQVRVQVEIDSEGNPVNLKPVAGHELLMSAVLPVLKRWKFSKGCKTSAETIEVVGRFAFNTEENASPKQTFVFEHPNRFVVTSEMSEILGKK